MIYIVDGDNPSIMYTDRGRLGGVLSLSFFNEINLSLDSVDRGEVRGDKEPHPASPWKRRGVKPFSHFSF